MCSYSHRFRDCICSLLLVGFLQDFIVIEQLPILLEEILGGVSGAPRDIAILVVPVNQSVCSDH
jgi:hypothetical protein